MRVSRSASNPERAALRGRLKGRAFEAGLASGLENASQPLTATTTGSSRRLQRLTLLYRLKGDHRSRKEPGRRSALGTIPRQLVEIRSPLLFPLPYSLHGDGAGGRRA